MQNGYAESFNGQMRDELLNETLFTSLNHARSVITQWVADYNNDRPHSSLDYLTPVAHAAKFKAIGSGSTPLRGSAPEPIAQPAPHGVTLAATLLGTG